jgi:hypothetical protein
VFSCDQEKQIFDRVRKQSNGGFSVVSTALNKVRHKLFSKFR